MLAPKENERLSPQAHAHRQKYYLKMTKSRPEAAFWRNIEPN
jgi:hypothetical protein